MYYFRADGSAATGAGHLMRCLTVAQELQNRIDAPEEVCFLCADVASAELLRNYHMPVQVLGTDPEDLEGELPVLESVLNTVENIFLVDSYRVTDAYLSALRRLGKVFLLDDMQQHGFPVDGVINYNLFASPEKYREFYGSETLQYLGAVYVPVRQQFCEAAGSYTVTDTVTDVLITTGGGDRDNIAGEILRELCEHSLKDSGVRFHLVIGKFNPNREVLEQYATEHREVILHCNVQDMASLMATCQLAVTAGGTTIYELSVLGVPFVCFSYAENQERLTAWIGSRSIAGYAGAWHHEPETVRKAIGSWCLAAFRREELRAQCYEAERQLIDGRGAARIAQILINAGDSMAGKAVMGNRE